MAGPDTQRQRRRPAKPRGFQILGIKLSRREFIFLACCMAVIIVGAVWIILSGTEQPPEEEPKQDPSLEDQQAPPPAPFAISQATAALDPGGQLTLTVSGQKGDVTWSTSDGKVAAVSDGVVTAVAGGTATITAVSGSEAAVCTVTVSGDPYADNLYLNHSDFIMKPGDIPVQMKVKYQDTKEVYEGAVVWQSADPQVATVSETGLVERVGKGTTTVTATVCGQVLECIVRVK